MCRRRSMARAPHRAGSDGPMTGQPLYHLAWASAHQIDEQRALICTHEPTAVREVDRATLAFLNLCSGARTFEDHVAHLSAATFGTEADVRQALCHLLHGGVLRLLPAQEGD